MKKAIIIALLFSSVCYTHAQTFNAQLAGMLQDTFNTYVSQISNIKGMSAAVYVPGQGTWQAVSGVSYAGHPITADMRFGIASNTKLFVSTIMLMLAEDGIISLNDSLHDWLPNYTNINPSITIRQLLNHTSGISDPIFVSPWMDTIKANPTRVFTPNEVLSWVGAPLFAAGTSWGYSNTNYILAGMIAKNATGFHISKLIRDSILTPLNMDNTFYDVEEPVTGVLAHRWWNLVDYNDTSRVGLNTAGGCAGSLFSTASEMTQWYHALFSGQILSAASLNELTGFVATNSPVVQYGLGLSRDQTLGYTYWGHGGSTWGYKSKMIYDSCLHVVVCGLCNSFPAGMDAVTFLLYRVVVNHIPGCCGAITGPVSVMVGTNSITYTVPVIPNATSYVWTLPSGVTGISNTNSITVDFSLGATSGNITVTGVNSYGTGGSASLWVDVYSISLSAEVVDFAVRVEENSNSLEWITASEINNDFFSVERSARGIYFEQLAQIQGAGSSSTTIKYIWKDSIPLSGTSYYRIVQTDFDGMQKIYGPLGVNRGEVSGLLSTVTVFPNPFSAEATLFLKEYCFKCVLEIYNSTGQKVMMKNFSGYQTKVGRTDLDEGLYFFTVRNNERRIAAGKIIAGK
jgi:CubicO group peptidase (beta-lactamase class C family)